MLSCTFSRQSEPVAIKECGVKPTINRTFRSGSRAIFDRPQYRIVKLLSLQQYKSLSTLFIAIDRFGQQLQDESHKIYSSTDRGVSWHLAKGAYRCQQHPSVFDTDECVISNADYQTLYRLISNKNGYFISVSHNGGISWNDVKLQISGSGTINRVRIVETGEKRAGRIYAWVNASEGNALYISDDFGQTLNHFSNDIIYAKESKIESSVYGLKGLNNLNSMALVVSHNSGKSWQSIENAKELFLPLYRSYSPMGVRSWRENENDDELLVYEFPISQIEIDPQNAGIFYLRSFKGLYRSIDGGRSFMLLPLAKDLLLGIDNICVDPFDGRYLYASVNENTIYRSSDYGCTWDELALPE